MKISSEILITIFDPLRTWAEGSTGNWNMLIGSGFVLVFIGLILIFVYLKKIGEADERTNHIKLISALIMLFVLVLCDIIFPKEYMWQIFFLYKYSIAFFATGIYLVFRYIKDFN
ncbi:DUF2178 domain-containing protein [Virgibacillus sp. MG-45]|uniref:DUF2178 domain-containing protein n=1 Tax=Virgibacillus sp. MG-45 TaxID=3102791 RepID=UPI002ED86B3B